MQYSQRAIHSGMLKMENIPLQNLDEAASLHKWQSAPVSHGFEIRLPAISLLTSTFGQTLNPPTIPFPNRLPISTSSKTSTCESLSTISCAKLDIPEPISFIPSKDLKKKLKHLNAKSSQVNELSDALIDEAKDYASNHKELVRSALKECELKVHHSLR
eukprot:IDg8636t1